MKYALISDNRILQVAEAAEGGGEPFTVNAAFQWVACKDDVTEWFSYEDGKFLPPAPVATELADPVEKLAAFLNSNPDVKALLS